MALSGTFYGTTTNERVKPKIVWSAVQDVAGNWSDVTATLYYSRTNNTDNVTAGMWKGTITIDGATRQESKRLSISYNSNTQAITHTVRVYHDSYGSKSITVSATGGIEISSMTATEISATVTLDTIPRAASVSAVNGDIGSRTTVVTDRKNTAFTHSIAFAFGSESGYIKADGSITDTEEKLTAAVINFLLPETFYHQIPDSPTGVCSLTCRTYDGSTLIGEDTAAFTVTANRALSAPLVSGTVVDTNPATVALTGDSTVLVAGASTAVCTLTAQARNGASIAEKFIGGEAVSGDSRTVENIEPCSIVFAAADSRGYPDQAVVSPRFVPYVKLTCDPDVRRTDPTSGNAVLTVKGRCYRGSFGAVENTLTVTCQTEGGTPVTAQPVVAGDNSYTVTLPLSGLDYTAAHRITVTVRDALSAVTKTLTVRKGLPVFDWGEKDFQFHVPVTGDFYGTVQGLHIQTFSPSGSTVSLQSKLDRFDEDSVDRQTLLFFGDAAGTLVSGVMGLDGDGIARWQGTEGVRIAATRDGQFAITLPGTVCGCFTLLSAEPFSIL